MSLPKLPDVIDTVRARLRAVLRRSAVDREMRDEMALHLDQAVERLMRRGLSEAEARYVARREFGNVALLQEEGRDARGARWIESCASDVRFAMRHFSRTPLTAITLVLVLSLGIGVNSAIFSFVQALTMRPPPAVPASDALVRVRGTVLWRAQGRLRPRDFSLSELNAIAARRQTFSAVAGWSAEQMVVDLGDGSDPRLVRGHFVTPNYFATLDVRPAIGPGLPARRTDDAPGAELVGVIAHSLWDELGRDTLVTGRVVRVNDVPVRIVGVAPPLFQGPIAGPDSRATIWLPLDARAPVIRSTGYALVNRDSTLLQAVGRLAPNTTVETATSVVRVIAAAWIPSESGVRTPAGTMVEGVRGAAYQYSSDVVPLRGDTEVGSGDPVAFTILGSGGLLVLLIACTNVSALLVGAAVARRREIAIRLSLGASRARVVRQLVTESSLIALAGGALGLTIYWSLVRVIAWAYMDPGLGPDLGTVGFTTFVALGTGIVFGLSPALHATRLDVSNALKDTGAGATSRSRLQRAFIVAQIGLTQPLLLGLATMIGGVLSDRTGSRVDHPLAARVTKVQFAFVGGVDSPNARQARLRDVMDRVARLPGVERVVPEAAGLSVSAFRVHAADRSSAPGADEVVRTQLEGTPPGYFTLQNIPMVRGRDLVAEDTAGREMSVVIDSDFARGFWGAVDPIGKRLDVTSPRLNASMTAVVVGVFDAALVPTRGAGRVYTAHGARWAKHAYLVRTRGPGTAIVPSVRQLALAAVPDIPIYRIATIEQLARAERRDVMLLSASASGGGLLALLLASIGLYGVVALAVRQRHREIGIRVALGARPRQVVVMFFASGLRLSVLGIILGLPFSVVVLHQLTPIIAEQLPVNLPLVGAVIAVAVIGVASLATWIPARRATHVDPLVAIRVE